ncbi:MAG TPA: hypothetical protein VFJ43_04725, partial [Bacteroidia bacterium]|nr:hypothetical protein [Bacteroidia bacterium]
MKRKVILFLIFISGISCSGGGRKNSMQKKDSVVALDSLLQFRKVLKTITDTLPEFKPAKIFLLHDQGDYIHAKGEDSSYSLSTIYSPDGKFEEVAFIYKKRNLEKDAGFYSDGKLRCSGVLVYNSGTLIGKWNYYSETGKPDSIVDFDEKDGSLTTDYYKKIKINYADAIQIAEKRGWSRTDFIVYGINYSTGFSWQIIHTEKPK